MIGRRKVTLSREGWYYLFVLTFILGGALFREVNLLLMLSAMMVGPLIFSWRIAAGTLRRLSVERKAPSLCHAGEPTMIELAVHNQRSWLPSWMLTATDVIDQVAETTVLFDKLPAGETRQQPYRITFAVRGRHRYSHVRLITRYPFGFVKAAIDVACDGEQIVAPALGQLTQLGQSLISGGKARQRTAKRRGAQQAEYYGIRDWRSGDSRRWIHWRSSAKSGELAVLQFHEQQDDELALLLDLWQPSAARPSERAAVELAVSVAATMIVAAARQRGRRLVVCVLGEQSQCWRDSASPPLVQHLLEHLAEVRGTERGELPAASLEQLWQQQPGRVMVISTRSQADFSTIVTPQVELGRTQALLSDWLGHQEVRWLDVTAPALDQFFRPPAGAEA